MSMPMTLGGIPIVYDEPRAGPDLLFVSPRIAHAIRWQIEEERRWIGRDRRRIKREYRKWMARYE